MLLVLNERIPTPPILGAVVDFKLGARLVGSMSMWEATFCEANSSKLLWGNSVFYVEPDFVVVNAKSKTKTGASWWTRWMLGVTAGVAHTHIQKYMFDDDAYFLKKDKLVL